MPTSQKVTREPGDKKKKKDQPKKTTSKDMPGSGMAKKAAEAIEYRQAQRKELLRNL